MVEGGRGWQKGGRRVAEGWQKGGGRLLLDDFAAPETLQPRERLRAGDIVREHHAVSAAVVRGAEGGETLLASGVVPVRTGSGGTAPLDIEERRR